MQRLGPTGITIDSVARTVLERHARRRRNPRSADWVVSGGRFEVVYNWPTGDDETTALVVTVLVER